MRCDGKHLDSRFFFLYYPTPTKGWLAGFGLQSDSHRLPPMSWQVGKREFKIQIHLHRCMQVTNNLISIKFCGSAISEIFFIQLYWTCLTVGADLFFSSNRWSWFLFYSPLALVEKRCSLSLEDFFRSPDTRSFSITLGWWTLGRWGRKTLCDQTSQLYCSHPFYCLRFLEWVNLQVSRPFIRCCAPFNIWQSNVETEFKRWRFGACILY